MTKEGLAVDATFLVADTKIKSFERRVRNGRVKYRQKKT
jgi:hypothetical protein